MNGRVNSSQGAEQQQTAWRAVWRHGAYAGLLALGMVWAASPVHASQDVASQSLVSKSLARQEVLPEYQKVSGISGNLSSVGSDTFANLMTYWTEEFKRYYPSVNIQVQAAGSSTAPTALVEATAQFGPMSRRMKTKEITAFEKEFGYKPTEIRVAIDALAVFVNQDNPLKGLNFAQLDAIYSQTLRCGGTQSITRWGQLGLTGSWAARDIQLFGRNSVSGTYGYFKQKACATGIFAIT
ncbi:phosphate ABC transporter periplasmic phosphate-binding protein PstS [Photobacterium aphoticum]|uniref:Phosphate ABC transporter periplasmic phosphate-binding protein PstS n=1 Tax=Photobacterium aphoticum TaxID=754436 RepID=A0A090QZI4_9GAMM|nr:phosphate ABC transporter periplasmic phosphate-binding protein PstS [Photobacterium aphoticum]